MQLPFVERRLPFGESPKTSKRSHYHLADPFLAYWYRFVHPSLSLLEQDLVDDVWSTTRVGLVQHQATVWEDLARRSAAVAPLAGHRFFPGAPWWGSGADGAPLELDVVAESLDGRALLVGEAKWERSTDVAAAAGRLRARAARFFQAPKVRTRAPVEIVYALWCKRPSGAAPDDVVVFGPDDVCRRG